MNWTSTGHTPQVKEISDQLLQKAWRSHHPPSLASPAENNQPSCNLQNWPSLSDILFQSSCNVQVPSPTTLDLSELTPCHPPSLWWQHITWQYKLSKFKSKDILKSVVRFKPEVLIKVIIVTPCRMWCSAISIFLGLLKPVEHRWHDEWVGQQSWAQSQGLWFATWQTKQTSPSEYNFTWQDEYHRPVVPQPRITGKST
jgi:hypothetical protein